MDQPPAPWTAERVAERLVMAFRLMPFHPVYSDRGTIRMDGYPGSSEVLTWPARYLADRRARMVVMTWARCRASGESVRDHYRGLGWPRSPTERRRREALATIAAGLNSDLTMGPMA